MDTMTDAVDRAVAIAVNQALRNHTVYLIYGEAGGVLDDLQVFTTHEALVKRMNEMEADWGTGGEEGYANFRAVGIKDGKEFPVGWLSSGVDEDGNSGWDLAGVDR